MQPPRILDFASVRLDDPEDFGDEKLAEHETKICEWFDERAPNVFSILDELQTRYGIWYYDTRPGNIEF